MIEEFIVPEQAEKKRIKSDAERREIMDKEIIVLNQAEIQSKLNRVKLAELLISQLPKTHEGRNSWLLNYGTGKEATKIRSRRNERAEKGECDFISWDCATNSLKTVG